MLVKKTDPHLPKLSPPSADAEPAELMSDNVTAAWLNISRATLWRRAADGSLPQPIRLGGRTMWRRSELLRRLDELCAERDGEGVL